MNRGLMVVAALVVGGLVGSGVTLGAQHLQANNERLTAGSFGGSTVNEATRGTSYRLDGGTVCVSGGVAQITAVRLRHAEGGLKVTGYSLHKSEMADRVTDVVTSKCKKYSDAGQRLVVSVSSATLPAGADGFVIDYTINGHAATTSNRNFGLLCDPAKKKQSVPVYGKILPKCYN